MERVDEVLLCYIPHATIQKYMCSGKCNFLNWRNLACVCFCVHRGHSRLHLPFCWLGQSKQECIYGTDGRVVKALDSKSNGIFLRRFESCSVR